MIPSILYTLAWIGAICFGIFIIIKLYIWGFKAFKWVAKTAFAVKPPDKKLVIAALIPFLFTLWLASQLPSHFVLLLLGGTTLNLAALTTLWVRKANTGRNLSFAAYLGQLYGCSVIAYFILLLCFFLPILLIENIWNLVFAVFSPLIILLFALYVFGFVPIVMNFRALNHSYQHVTKNFPKRKVHGVSALFLIMLVVIGSVVAAPPDKELQLSLLEKIRNEDDFSRRQEYINRLLEQEQEIKAALKSKYYAENVYFGDRNFRDLAEYYHNESVQNLFNVLAKPFLYPGNFPANVGEAAAIYEEIFDEPIYEMPKKEWKPYQGNYSRQQTAQPTNTKPLPQTTFKVTDSPVKVVQRHVEVTTKPNSLFATVTITEEYKNVGRDIEEGRYRFKLPNNSVVTELFLGPNLEFEGVISPKFAAESVYRAQLPQRKDPALIEKRYGNTYDLRVYPIAMDVDQRVRYSYIAPIESGGVALPRIADNWWNEISGTPDTVYTYSLNGSSLSLSDSLAAIPVRLNPSILQTIPYVTIGDQNILFISEALAKDGISRLFSTTESSESSEQSSQVQEEKVAFLLDLSYSQHSQDWKQFFQGIKELNRLLQKGNVDIYFFNSKLSQPIPLNQKFLDQGLNKYQAYGESHKMEALNQIRRKYKAVFMVTDKQESGYVNLDGNLESSPRPLYLIYTNNPANVSDICREYLLANNAKSFKSINEALHDFWKTEPDINLDKIKEIELQIDIENRYLEQEDQFGRFQVYSPYGYSDFGRWYMMPKQKGVEFSGEYKSRLKRQEKLSPFHRVAISKNIMMARQKELTVTDVDVLHQLAVENSIVTDYSSLIALVNDEQRQQLETAERKDNRYGRHIPTQRPEPQKRERQSPGRRNYNIPNMNPFFIPKVLNSGASSQNTAIWKESASTISGAFSAYQLSNGNMVTLTADDLSEYMNFVRKDEFNGIVTIQLHNGGTIRYRKDNRLGYGLCECPGALVFEVDPDAEGGVEPSTILVYENGRISDGENGTCLVTVKGLPIIVNNPDYADW